MFINKKHKKMKSLKMLLIAVIFMVATQAVHAQKEVMGMQDIKCTMKVENAPKQVKNVLDLFVGFREGKHQIIFTLEGKTTEIVFETTVKKDGKVIGTGKRQPMPYFPGDMYIAPEAFDFISLLPYSTKGDEFGKLENGTYEIELNAKPAEGKVKTQSVIFKFIVKN